MRTHPLWRPYGPPSLEEIEAGRVAPVTDVTRMEVVAPDPTWREWFASVRERVAAALGERAHSIEHVGSTAVPDLWAKPLIDVDLVVDDSADEDAWLPDLEAAGFVLTRREPDWQEHRLLRGTAPRTNLHVWSTTAEEPRRHVMFRDWLRTHPAARERYAAVKRDVAAQGHTVEMLYNNAKAWVIYDIYEEIFAADPAHPHDPHPRVAS